MVARGDPDDPFNGSANGIFQTYQDNFSLPSPVQMPRRQENTIEPREHSWKSPRSTNGLNQKGAKMKEKVGTGQMQGTHCELSKHLLVSPDPMRSVRNLHTQQRQNHLQAEVLNQNKAQSGPIDSPQTSSQELNLITFTPLQGQHEAVQGAAREQDKPKKQRNPRRRKTKNEWQLNQRQFEQNKKFPVFHQVDRLTYSTQKNRVYPICNCLQEQPKKIIGCAQNAVKLGTGSIILEQQLGADSVRQKHMQLKPAEICKLCQGQPDCI